MNGEQCSLFGCKSMIFTSERRVEHPFSGQNTQQTLLKDSGNQKLVQSKPWGLQAEMQRPFSENINWFIFTLSIKWNQNIVCPFDNNLNAL